MTPPAVGVAFDGTGVGLAAVGVGTGVSLAGVDGDVDADAFGVAFAVAFAVGFAVLPVVGATTGTPDVPGADEAAIGVEPAGTELAAPDDTGALAPELAAATSADGVGLVCFDELVQPVTTTAMTATPAHPTRLRKRGRDERGSFVRWASGVIVRLLQQLRSSLPALQVR